MYEVIYILSFICVGIPSDLVIESVQYHVSALPSPGLATECLQKVHFRTKHLGKTPGVYIVH